jgi:hypothetical protein
MVAHPSSGTRQVVACVIQGSHSPDHLHTTAQFMMEVPCRCAGSKRGGLRVPHGDGEHSHSVSHPKINQTPSTPQWMGLTCEPPRGIEPRTCSLRGDRTPPPMASTSDNSCRSHTFECTSGTVRHGFAPRLIPRHRLRRPNRGQRFGGSAECRPDRRSRSADLVPELLSRPDGAAATEEIMVPVRRMPASRTRAADGQSWGS